MSISLSLLKKIRCRFLNRSNGTPVPGVIASLSVEVGDATNSVRLPIATLCSDATGYTSFDLKPLIDLGLDTASGFLISAPRFGLENYNLLASFVAPPPNGGKENDPNAGGSVPSPVGGNMFTQNAAPNGEKKEPPCIVFPIYLDNHSQDKSEGATCAPTRLPSIQAPDACDYKASPFSFVTPAALKLGNDCCEILLPSSLPIQQYRFYKVVIQRDDTGSTGLLQDTPLNKRVTILDALEPRAAVIKFGEIQEYQQDWYSLGHSLGEIKYSLPLAPGESTQLAVIEWSRDDLASRKDQIRSTEFLDHDSRRDRAIEDTVDAALREEQGGNSFMAGTSGTASGQTYGTGMWTGNHAIGGGASYSYGKRNLTGESLQDLHDRVRQASSSVRSLNSTVIVQGSQAETNTLQTRRVANHNHCHALTIQYYEVLRHYRMSTRFTGRREAVLVPFTPFVFSSTSWELALRFRTVLEQTLLDPSLKNCFEALVRLNIIPEVYDAPPKRPVTPPVVTKKKRVEVKGILESGIGSGVIVKKGDAFSINASGRVVNFRGAGDQHDSRGPDGIPHAADSEHIAPGLRVVSLIFKIGQDGPWQQGGSFTSPTADRDGEIVFGMNDAKGFFDDNVGYGDDFWTVELTYPSHETDTSTTDPTKDDALHGFRKIDDRLCSARLLNHLQNNQGYYNGAVCMLMDAVERRLRLEAALHDQPEILAGIDDRPIALSGNYVAFQYSGPQAIGSSNDDPSAPLENILTLPTRGLFAEAQMGHCNSCEERDVTRMWDWTEMTTETPPDISGISPGPKGAAPSITPGQLPSNVIQITQPQAAPDPTGLANALNVLKTPDIFRNMSGLDDASKLLGELAKDATDANTKAMALQGQIEIEKIKADAKKSAPGGSADNSRTPASETDPAKQVDRLKAIEYAKDKGLISVEQGTNAAEGVLGGESTSSSDAGTMEDKLAAPSINLAKYCTPMLRSYSPGNPIGGKSGDKTGQTTLRAVVDNAPPGSTWHWSVATPTAVKIVSPSSYTTEVIAGEPGLVDVAFEARDSLGKSLGKKAIKLCVPQFVVIDEDAATFNPQLVAYHLDDVKVTLLQKVKQVVDFLLANANVRTIWRLAPFNEGMPAHLAAGGFAAGKFNPLTIHGTPPAPGVAGKTGLPIGPRIPDEPINIYPGAYTMPGTDVGVDVAAIVTALGAQNMTDPDIKSIWIEGMARLLGETIAHEIHHSLLGLAGFDAGGHNSPPIQFDLMNRGMDRVWLQRTGIEIISMVNFPQPGSYRDGGAHAISSVQTSNQTKVDASFPVPPAFL